MKPLFIALMALSAAPASAAEVLSGRINVEKASIELDLRYRGGNISHSFRLNTEEALCAVSYPPKCFFKVIDERNGDTGTELRNITVELPLPVTTPGADLKINGDNGSSIQLTVPELRAEIIERSLKGTRK